MEFIIELGEHSQYARLMPDDCCHATNLSR
jgi:hypothetical protein